MNYDEAMLRMMSEVSDRLFAPVRRVSRGEMRWSGFSDEQKRRCIGHWLSKQDDQEDWINDALVSIKADDILRNFEAGDDAANGELIRRALMEYIGKACADDDEYWREDAT